MKFAIIRLLGLQVGLMVGALILLIVGVVLGGDSAPIFYISGAAAVLLAALPAARIRALLRVAGQNHAAESQDDLPS